MFDDDFDKHFKNLDRDFDRNFRRTQNGIFAFMGVALFLYFLGLAGIVTLTVILLKHFSVI